MKTLKPKIRNFGKKNTMSKTAICCIKNIFPLRANSFRTIGLILWVMLNVSFLHGDFSGSGHDFTGRSWLEKGRTCSVCHSYTRPGTVPSDTLLRNHTLTTASFIPYSSFTLKASVGQPEGISRSCLSCHDGTVAIDSFDGQIGTERAEKIVGPNLSEIHPVSFVYNDSLAMTTGHLKRPSEPSGLGGTIEEDLLKNGRVECTSCHEAHNRFNQPNLLIKTDARGANGLCSMCHTTNPPGALKMGKWE